MTKESFKPAWWLPGPHLQTIWPTVFRRRQLKKLPFIRERFELPDGDFIDLDWLDKDKKDAPIVMVLHGLEGSIKSPYALGMMRAIQTNGWRALFVHFRGCSGEMNRMPHAYHSGYTYDIMHVAAYIKKAAPHVPLAAIGFSLGGNVLLKWLAESGDKNPLSAAVTVSVPFELHKASHRLQYGFSRFYQWYLLRSLRRKMQMRIKKFSHLPIKSKTLKKLRTLREFDNYVTAPLHGFLGAHDYYVRASSRSSLKHIRVPTLLLQAQDDPFMTEDVIPKKDELPQNIQLEVTQSGGHVGFVTGNVPWKPQYWLEHRAPLFLKEFLIPKEITV